MSYYKAAFLKMRLQVATQSATRRRYGIKENAKNANINVRCTSP